MKEYLSRQRHGLAIFTGRAAPEGRKGVRWVVVESPVIAVEEGDFEHHSRETVVLACLNVD